MDVLVTGRHCQIPDEFRARVEERIASIEKLKDRVIRVEVQVSAYGYKKQPDQSTRVEITLRSRGPVVRAEASADDKNVAFDHALDRLKSQLRRASDRRKTHRGLRGTGSLADAALAVPAESAEETRPEIRKIAGLEIHGDGPLVVREKYFDAVPLTLAQALDEMELVGHDFFLYVDAESGHPSAVYRRKAYDYGVIHLNLDAVEEATA
ncbi:MAG TPA: ribosome-associated translation inhibitor RaiA [Propionicimonas sp.]|nr:ribosome-associated translation inhibitor RaiA [Propionicimonas sp.]HQA78170.1 ribosome-associated translation inhibitor RaiA [Propionicimonas sp.]HQD96328.1 ribosome-associated translation inhibitor RaiA [Propionicimonas sp.]